MRKHRVLRNILLDILLAGAALVVFALFHHVLPRQQQSLGIVISNPYQTGDARNGSEVTLPENAVLIASGGLSDSATLSARGSGRNGGGSRQNSSRGGQNGMNSKGGSALSGD